MIYKSESMRNLVNQETSAVSFGQNAPVGTRNSCRRRQLQREELPRNMRVIGGGVRDEGTSSGDSQMDVELYYLRVSDEPCGGSDRGSSGGDVAEDVDDWESSLRSDDVDAVADGNVYVSDVDWLDVCDSGVDVVRVVDIKICFGENYSAAKVRNSGREGKCEMRSEVSDAPHIIDEICVVDDLKTALKYDESGAGDAVVKTEGSQTQINNHPMNEVEMTNARNRSHGADERTSPTETPEEININKTPMEEKRQKAGKRERGAWSPFQEPPICDITQKPTTLGRRKSPKHYGNSRVSARWESIWMKARMLILSSIWLLQMLSDKMLTMTVLLNVLSSAFPSTAVVRAESFKVNEKGVAPLFLEPVPNVTVAVGRDASLTCTVDHLGMHKVAWIHLDRQMILSIHNHVITRTPRFSVTHDSHKTWTLHVTQVKEEDRGHYMCQVNTKPMISQTGFLQVVVPPNILDERSSPSSIVVREKDEVSLSCHGEGFPVPHIKWRREDGQPIETPDGRRVDHLDGPNLPLHQVSRIDMGAYLCIASNGVPPSVSKRITLDVEFAPQMHVPNQLVGAPLETQVHLECFVEAHPRAITYWEFSDAMVMNTSRITTDTLEELYRIHMVLTIKDLQDSDFGTYKCISKNSIAETDGSITLNKTYRPTSPPQTMLHSSDDDTKPYLTRGRVEEQQRKQLEASRRRFQEEETEKRHDEDARKRTPDTDRQTYDRDRNQGYDTSNNRITNPPISMASRIQVTFSAIYWLSLRVVLQLL